MRNSEVVLERISEALTVVGQPIRAADLIDSKGKLKVWETFLHLTGHTCPGTTTPWFLELLTDFGFGQDKVGNIIGYRGAPEAASTIFCSHVDTVGSVKWVTNEETGRQEVETTPVGHVVGYDDRADRVWVRTDGSTVLGADDKAGVTIMLNLWLNHVPGLYYFFLGEEAGCVGSKAAVKAYTMEQYDRIIAFDRHSYGSIITHQSGKRSCSDEFTAALVKQLDEINGKPGHWAGDDGGSFTDSASFFNCVPECTNMSVGYFDQHMTAERQDLDYLTAVARIYAEVDWDDLPTDRTLLTKRPPKSYNYTGYNYAKNDTTWDKVQAEAAAGTLTLEILGRYLTDCRTDAQKRLYEFATGEAWLPFSIEGVQVQVGDILTKGDDRFEVRVVSEYTVQLYNLSTKVLEYVGAGNWRTRGYGWLLSQAKEGLEVDSTQLGSDELNERELRAVKSQ